MADVRILKGAVADGTITSLDVEMHGLPARTIDRDTALSWMKDGHSFIPMIGGARGPALLLVEVGDEHFIRSDTAKTAADQLPNLA